MQALIQRDPLGVDRPAGVAPAGPSQAGIRGSTLGRLSLGLAVVAVGASAAAQTEAPRYFTSTTSDVATTGPLGTISDGDVLLLQEGVAPSLARGQGHWRALAGVDLGDLDALARRPGSVAGTVGSVAFSTLSNVAPWRDGDVLAIAPGGGVELVLSEDALTAALGLAEGSIDVDAMAWDAEGRFHFSVQSDAAGTTLGDLNNGDILRLEDDGTVKRVLTEIDIEEKLFLATGSTAAVGDVHGLDIVAGESIVTIQSPSAYDGGVLDCGIVPQFLLTEDGAGLGGAELDALMAVGDGDVLPTIWFDTDATTAGSTVHVEMRGAPGAAHLVLWAGDAGYVAHAGGIGGWFLDPADAWLGSIFAGATLPLAPIDGAGAYAIDYTLPLGVQGVGMDGAPGWTFQTMDLATLAVSAPYRIAAL